MVTHLHIWIQEVKLIKTISIFDEKTVAVFFDPANWSITRTPVNFRKLMKKVVVFQIYIKR